MNCIKSVVLVACLLMINALSVAGQDKIKVDKLDDLPRYTYKIDVPVTELYKNEKELVRLAKEVKRDLLSDLDKYEITDKTTLQDYYANLGSIAIIDKDWSQYLHYLEERKQLEEKESNRLTMGLAGAAIALARQKSGDSYEDNVRSVFRDSLSALSYELVQDNLKSLKGRTEILSENLVLGAVKERYQSQLEKSNGEMSEATARALLGRVFTLEYFIPLQGVFHQELGQFIKAHDKQKPDIWAQRTATLKPGEGQPVVVAVWDSGVDTEIFAASNQLWTNTKEIPGNDKDDDNNGFVDDVHGIAYSLHSDKEKSLLYPMSEINTSEDVMRMQTKGLTDIQASVESEEASALRAKLATLKQEDVKPFIEELSMYGNYSHGTHVAGIAAEGNPNARILVSRITFDYRMVPEEPTIKKARKEARALVENIEYFKKQGVRAVNMSWGGALANIESALEANNAGGDAKQRKALAREIFKIGDEAFRQAIKDAPEILFIVAAGNSDSNVTFEEFYPSAYDYPNMLSVGAVDQAGEETSFTSFGKVDLYANGFEVDSYVPGGKRLKLSGTSMASPQVLNLAGKLLSLKPGLSTEKLRLLILQGTDHAGEKDRPIKLLNQKASMELL